MRTRNPPKLIMNTSLIMQLIMSCLVFQCGDLGRSPSWTVEVDGSACQRAIAARQDGAQNRLSRVEEIATMQVCKYDAPRRRRLGRVTTERRKSVGAEREQKGRERRLEAWPLAGCLPCDSGLRRNRRHRESPTKHPATGRGRGKAVKVYSAKNGGGTAPR